MSDAPAFVPPIVLEALSQAADEYGVPLRLLAGVAWVESRWNPRAVSPAGAKGLMQIMPKTAASLGITDPYSIKQSAFGGAKFLAQLVMQFHGSWEQALAAYNWGPSRVAHGGEWPRTVQQYVSDVWRAGASVQLPFPGPVWICRAPLPSQRA